jgi:hypothetical protein
MRVPGKRIEISDIGGEHRPVRFGEGDDECVDGGSAASLPAQECGTSCKRLSDVLHDFARLEKPIRDCIATGVPLQALDQHYRGNRRRPQVSLAKGEDQRGCLRGALG